MAISDTLGELRTLDIEDGCIEYRICGEGQGPTVVFLHGIIANADVWRGVVANLASDHHCVAPDWPLGAHRLGMRPGTDFSLPGIARTVERFLVAAGLDQVVLVGNDTGGAVAQYVVAAHPQRIAALVLTPCDAFDNFVPLPIRHLRLFGRTPWGLWLLAQTLRLRFAQRLPIAFGLLTERPIPAAIMRSYTGPLRDHASTRRDFAALVRNIHPRYTIDVAPRLAGYRQPVLLMWARERRRFFPLEHAHRGFGAVRDGGSARRRGGCDLHVRGRAGSTPWRDHSSALSLLLAREGGQTRNLSARSTRLIISAAAWIVRRWGVNPGLGEMWAAISRTRSSCGSRACTSRAMTRFSNAITRT